MQKKRYPKQGLVGELTPTTIQLLFYGWGAPPASDDPDPFFVYTLSDADFKALWCKHRVQLMKEWRRRGETGSPLAAWYDDDCPRATKGQSGTLT